MTRVYKGWIISIRRLGAWGWVAWCRGVEDRKEFTLQIYADNEVAALVQATQHIDEVQACLTE